MNKTLKKHKDLFILLSFAAFLLVFMVLIGGSFAFFSKNKKATGQITLGELDYTINVENNENVFVLPGDTVNISVNIENKVENKNNLVPFYFRFKIFDDESTFNNDFISLILGEDFIKDENFVYYKYKLNFKEKVEIINGIYIDTSLTQEQAKKLSLNIMVEAVQSEYGAYKEVFYDAPKEWLEFVENN